MAKMYPRSLLKNLKVVTYCSQVCWVLEIIYLKKIIYFVIRLGQGSIFHALIQLSLLSHLLLSDSSAQFLVWGCITQNFFVCNLFREYPSFSIYHVLTSVFGRKGEKQKRELKICCLGLDTNLMIYEQRKITDSYFSLF